MKRFCFFLVLLSFLSLSYCCRLVSAGQVVADESSLIPQQAVIAVLSALVNVNFDGNLIVKVEKTEGNFYFLSIQHGTRLVGDYFKFPFGLKNTSAILVRKLFPPPPPEPAPRPKTLIEQGFRLVEFPGPSFDAGDDIRIISVRGKGRAYFSGKDEYTVGWKAFEARWPNMGSSSPLSLWVPPGEETPEIEYEVVSK